jgi:hypothetical protein
MTTINLWNQPTVPHKGWICVDVIDTGGAESTCEMCGNECVRYLHVMSHADYFSQLDVGCVCAEKMTDDYVNPRKRERKLRAAAAKQKREQKRQREEKEEHRQQIINAVWRESKTGNPYLLTYLRYKHGTRKIHAVIVKSKFNDTWAFGTDGEFSTYKHCNAAAAKIAAKEAILRKLKLR